MRKTGIYTDGVFRQQDFERGFELIKASGFDCADYSGLLDPRSDFGGLEGGALTAKLREVKRAADSAGVEIYQMHGPWVAPLPNNTPEERRAWCEYAKKCIRASEVLGGPRYVVHPIMPFGVRGKETPEVVYETNREFLGEICRCAKEVGVTVCLENMPFPWMTVHSPAHIYGLVRELDIDNLKVCLDTGHALISGAALGDTVRELGAYIEALHVHDNHKQSDNHLCPFMGKGDWEGFRAAASESIPESVPLMLETGPSLDMPEDIRKGFLCGYAKIAKYLANIGEQRL